MSGSIGGPPLVEETGFAFPRGRRPASTLLSGCERSGFDSHLNCFTASCSVAPSSSSVGQRLHRAHLSACTSFLSSGLRWLRRRAALAPWVECALVLLFLCDGSVMGFTLKHATSAGPVHSSPASRSLFPGSASALSGVQTAAREAPSLNLEEDESCVFTGSVPQNLKMPVSTVEIEPSQWAEHSDDTVFVQSTLKAYQTTDIPGRERQCMMSFKLPSNLAQEGSAVLTIHKKWDGSSHQWSCSEHILSVTRLTDDHYLQGRNASSETEDVVEWSISKELIQFSTDLGSMVYGKGLAGQSLHLLFREKNQGCLSAFYSSKEEGGTGPVLAVDTTETASVDAVYGQWEPFASCRVPCVTPVNYQCRKRSCTPGKNEGAACKMELMVDKQPCSDPEVKDACTCSVLTQENACPPAASCDESIPNNVSCFCSGSFMRLGVDTKTFCDAGSRTVSTLGARWQDQTSSSLIALWVIIGVFLFILIVGCAFLLCEPQPRPAPLPQQSSQRNLLVHARMRLGLSRFSGVKRRPRRDEDLLTMNLDPQTGAPAPGTADLGAAMFWGQGPALGPPMGGYGPFTPAAGAPRVSQGGIPQMAGPAPPAMGYGMGGPPTGPPRSPSFIPMAPGTRL
ncbi:hypothetical protein Esti_000732 [Eimeria stiedai]